MTQSELDHQGFIIVNGKTEEITYRDYLHDYDDENKLYVKEIMHDVYQHDETKCNISSEQYHDLDKEERMEYSFIGEEVHHYEIYMDSPTQWRRGRTNNGEFDTEEEAQMKIYEIIELHIIEKNWNAPIFWDTLEEAEADIIVSIADQYSIDREVAESIFRKQKIVNEQRAIRQAAFIAKATKQYEERKAWLAIEVAKEAATLIIDDEFRAAVKWAGEAKGNEKSQRFASAMKGLLARNGKEKIESDFWQVVRILKSMV